MELVEVYDDGTEGANEVAHWKDEDAEDFVLKVMVISRPKVHQRRKAITEATFWELDRELGGDIVCNPVEVGMWKDGQFPYHEEHFGEENSENWQRMCWVKRGYSPGAPGDEWRGALVGPSNGLANADRHAKAVIENHPDAARIALLDILTGNQDRSARNWCAYTNDPERINLVRFFAIDNGMAWFHEYWSKGEQNNYPEYGWRQGFVIDNVLIQILPWRFISGVFSTCWEGKPLPPELLKGLEEFNWVGWRARIRLACEDLGYPGDMVWDWRFEAITRRASWMMTNARFPSAAEYRSWRENGSPLLTPPEVIASGGREIWNIKMDYEYLDEAAYKKLSGGPERPK